MSARTLFLGSYQQPGADGRTERVLAADLYDTLELVALVYGGIGGGAFFKGDASMSDPGAEPCCVHGLARLAPDVHAWLDREEIREALFSAGIGYSVNDHAVRRINYRKGEDETANVLTSRMPRVTFAEWCAELNVVRGPHTAAPAEDATWPEVAS